MSHLTTYYNYLTEGPVMDAVYGISTGQSAIDLQVTETDEPAQPDKRNSIQPSSSSVVIVQPRVSRPDSATRARTKAICPIPGCGRVVLQRVFARHLRTVHGQGRTHNCEICDMEFPRKDTLERHQSEQHGDNVGTVKCTRCGTMVVQRALKEHRTSQRCRGWVVAGEIRDVIKSIPQHVSDKDTTQALLAGDSYLVRIRIHGLPVRTMDTTLLEARQMALGSLRRASGAGSMDVEMICAVWIFGLADTICGGTPKLHQPILSKANRDVQERGAQFQEVLANAFRQCNGLQHLSRMLVRLNHERIVEPVKSIGEIYHFIYEFVPGCGFISSLAGFIVWVGQLPIFILTPPQTECLKVVQRE